MDDFLAISIVGVALSMAVQHLKIRFGASSLMTKVFTIVLSLLLGAIYYFFNTLAIWESVLGVLAAASTVYAMFYKK